MNSVDGLQRSRDPVVNGGGDLEILTNNGERQAETRKAEEELPTKSNTY